MGLLEILLGLVMPVLGMLLLFRFVHRRYLFLGRSRSRFTSSPPPPAKTRTIEVPQPSGYQGMPTYVDLFIGETVRIRRHGHGDLQLRVLAVLVEGRVLRSPRTRVVLEIDGVQIPVRCGMCHHSRGGIKPVEIDSLKVAVEITRLLFSTLDRGSSPFNSFRSFQLKGDLRLALWDANELIMPGHPGTFVLDQNPWTRDRFGNWLHRTHYGIHGAIDIYSSQHGEPERVFSPVDGTVFRVYNTDADGDDRHRNKVVNVTGAATVGRQDEHILYRFQHLSEILVGGGDTVRRGQVLGLTGHTGFDPRIGDHLHFEMRLAPTCLGFAKNDSLFATIPINPYNYLLEWYESEAR